MRLKFLYRYFIRPFAGRWITGILLVVLFAFAFVALPTIAGWFLTVCAIVFMTGNTTFSYLFPAAIIRLLSLVRTLTRYFDKTHNHHTVLLVEEKLRLAIFKKYGRLSHQEKTTLLDKNFVQTTIHSMDTITNHILSWMLPLTGFILSFLVVTLLLFKLQISVSVLFFTTGLAILTFLPPLLLLKYSYFKKALIKNKLHLQQDLIKTFESRIELNQYNLLPPVMGSIDLQSNANEQLDVKLQNKALLLQHGIGICMTLGALGMLFFLYQTGIKVELAVGIVLMIISFSELAESIWINRPNTIEFESQLQETEKFLYRPEAKINSPITEKLILFQIKKWQAKLPNHKNPLLEIDFNLSAGQWLAVFGKTGVGKTTFLNSLFYPEYKNNGVMIWNSQHIEHLAAPKAIYVTQDAQVLNGTLKDNFLNHAEKDILQVLSTVDLFSWYDLLPDKLDTFLGENGITLSGGQRKKLLLAQALLNSPDLLVIDEPTAGIDVESTLTLFKNIKKAYPTLTLLFVTHQLPLKEVADQIIELK